LVKLSIPSIYHTKAKLYFLWQITRHQTEIQYQYHSFSACQFSQNSFIAFNPVSGNYIGKHPYLKECDSTADNHICGPLDFEYGQDGKMFISNWNWRELPSYKIPDYKQQQLLDNVSATDIEYMRKYKD
jgi:hypothetical protein